MRPGAAEIRGNPVSGRVGGKGRAQIAPERRPFAAPFVHGGGKRGSGHQSAENEAGGHRVGFAAGEAEFVPGGVQLGVDTR